MKHRLASLSLALLVLAACSRDQAPPPEPEPAPPPPPPAGMSLRLSDFGALRGWEEADLTAALTAFQRSCARLAPRTGDAPMNHASPWAGSVSDWMPACEAAMATPHDPGAARRFFETRFLPAAVSAPGTETGLLTAYYEPELEVRGARQGEFTEPVLGRPDDLITVDLGAFDPDLAGKNLVGQVEAGTLKPYDPRARIAAERAPVIAWGRPADVFFLQVQGSGRLQFADGTRMRAAYAANNGRDYRSIGRVLIERGELTADQASKAGIERWMREAGPEAARDLMNENPRYIFFSAQPVEDPGRGPNGAQGAPLTPLASMAVDPEFHPYGAPVWLETRLPRAPGDAEAEAAGLLVVAQDTGGAIKGPMRGDLFWGTGEEAGALAGVMKHQAEWTVLLPVQLALGLAETAA